MNELNAQINDKNFWDNPQLAQKVSIEASEIEKLTSSLSDLEKDITEFEELVKLTEEEDIDEGEYFNELKSIENRIEEIENEALYFGEYDDLLERVYEADRKYSQMVQIMNTAFKEGGFIEAPQQDEVTEYLDSFAKNNEKVNIVDEVSSYLESLTDPDEDEDGDSNFNSDDEDFMKFDDISTEDILDPDKPAPWDRKKEA